jgi:uncharacterized protein YjbI with pentapeptide repeats
MNANFHKAEIPYAEFSHAVLISANFSGANLKQSVMHRIDDRQTNWQGANLKLVDYTDEDLAAAEDWKPPLPKE